MPNISIVADFCKKMVKSQLVMLPLYMYYYEMNVKAMKPTILLEFGMTRHLLSPGPALDFEMGGSVRRKAPNRGFKERIFGKNRAAILKKILRLKS